MGVYERDQDPPTFFEFAILCECGLVYFVLTQLRVFVLWCGRVENDWD